MMATARRRVGEALASGVNLFAPTSAHDVGYHLIGVAAGLGMRVQIWPDGTTGIAHWWRNHGWEYLRFVCVLTSRDFQARPPGREPCELVVCWRHD